RAVAEKLAQAHAALGLLVPGNAVAFHQGDEVMLTVALQRRLGEMRVLGEEIVRAAMQVGEVAAAAAGDADLLSRAGGMVEQQHAAAALRRHAGTEQPRPAGAEDDEVVGCCGHAVHCSVVMSGSKERLLPSIRDCSVARYAWLPP